MWWGTCMGHGFTWGRQLPPALHPETPAFVQMAFQAAVPDSRKSFPEADNEDDSLGTLVALRGGRRRVRHNMGLVHSGTRCQTRPGGGREPGASFCKAHIPLLSIHRAGRCAGVRDHWTDGVPSLLSLVLGSGTTGLMELRLYCPWYWGLGSLE